MTNNQESRSPNLVGGFYLKEGLNNEFLSGKSFLFRILEQVVSKPAIE